MNRRLFIFFTIIACIATHAHVSSQRALTQKTRTLPTSGTVHKASFFYRQAQPILVATPETQLFSFATNCGTKALEKLSKTSSHEHVTALKNTLIKQTRTYFKKQVSCFAKNPQLKKHVFSCRFTTKDVLKETHVDVALIKKKTYIEAEITLWGSQEHPSPEILNLVTGCIIDDPLILKHCGKILCISGLIIISILTKILTSQPPTPRLPPAVTTVNPHTPPARDKSPGASALKGTKPKDPRLRVRFADLTENE